MDAGGIAAHLQYNGINGAGVIENCVSHVNVSAAGTNRCRAGGIVGSLVSNANIFNCFSNGVIRAEVASNKDQHNAQAGGIAGQSVSGNIQKSRSSATVIASGGYYSHAGGIVGAVQRGNYYNAQKVFDCYSDAVVKAGNALMQNNAGGIAGQIETSSKIERCFSNAAISVSGDPGYFNAAGGIAGAIYNDSSITDCVGAGTIDANGFSMVGGVAGRVEGTLTRCYTITKINAPEALNYYEVNGMTGAVRDNLTIDNCGVFNVAEPHFVTGDYSDPAITAITAAELFKAETFTSKGWDFSNVWIIPSGGSYKLPILRGLFENEQKALNTPTW